MDNNKAAAAAVAAVISASGTAVEASFDNPADILQTNAPDPKVQDIGDDGQAPDSAVQDEDKAKTQAKAGGGVFREWILGLPMAVRALVVVPLWAVGSLIVIGGHLLFTALSPVLHLILSFLLMALVIAAAFTVTAKALFPDLPLRKILNRHSIKWILIGTAVAFAADLVLKATWADYASFRAMVTAGLILLVLIALVVWFVRRENRRRAREAEALLEAEEEEEPKELVYTSLGQTFTVRPEKGRTEH